MRDAGPIKPRLNIDVEFQYREDLTQINLDILSLDGTALTAQDIIDAVAETLLLKWDNYDLEAEPHYDA